MNLLLAVLGAFLGVSTGLVAPAVVRRLHAPNLDVQADYDQLAASRNLRRDTAAIATVACALLGLSLGWSAALPVWLCLGAVGTLLAVIDAHTRQLPASIINPCLLLVAAGILALSTATSDWSGLARAAAGWAAGGGLFGLVWLGAPASLGYGDVRLAALLAMALSWLSWPQLYLGLFFALLLGSVIAIVLLLRGAGRRHTIPFGPFLIAGAALAVGLPALHT